MKTKKQQFGQFLTDPIIANFMAELAYFEKAKKALDPAVGEGIFLNCLDTVKNNDLKYTAYDIDNSMIERSKITVKANVKYNNKDYLLTEIKSRPDIIICNPPYNKFQEIPNRNEYIDFFKKKFGFNIGSSSNLCVYFLIKSLFELKRGGKCVYIIPYEFLNTQYGQKIKRYFVQTKYLTAVYKFNSKLSVFGDATTTSSIFVFEKKKHQTVNFVLINSLEDIKSKNFKMTKSYSYADLDYKKKWNIYFNFESVGNYKNLISFSKIANVKRGIATGKNKFFSLNQTQINKLGLSQTTLIKCICKSQDIKVPIFGESDYAELYSADKKVCLFNGERAETADDFNYIKFGKKNGFDKGYLNSHRSPWYSLEKKEAAPIWISVFNREHLKVIRNETQTKNLTTFHGVYFNEPYNTERHINILYCYLLTPICHRLLKNHIREYGDGLDKFEPNDLNNSEILDISLISDDDSTEILSLYEKIKNAKAVDEKTVEKLDEIFKSYMIDGTIE